MNEHAFLRILFIFFLSSFGVSSASAQITQAEQDGFVVTHPSGSLGLTQAQIIGDNLPYRHLVLTYDDGVDADSLNLAQTLKARGIRATFFVNGCRFVGRQLSPCDGRQYPISWLNQLQELGHRIANHTEHHYALEEDIAKSWVGEDGIKNDFLSTATLVDPLIKDGYFFFRAPSNSWGERAYQAISPLEESKKYVGPFIYDASALDVDCLVPSQSHPSLAPDQCADLYYEKIMEISAQNGIIQMHDHNGQALGTSYTRELTIALLARLDATPGQKFTFVPLDAIPGVRGTSSSTPYNYSSLANDSSGIGDNPAYYLSMRIADINGDAKGDVCYKQQEGIYCALASAGGMGLLSKWLNLPDLDGWGKPEYASTAQLIDINRDGKADLCVRGVWGIYCFASNGTSFSATPTWFANHFSDANGWQGAESRYGSISYGDIDGSGFPSVCGRDQAGVICQRFNGSSFGVAERWLTNAFDDANGWNNPIYGATLKIADVNGDGKGDICGRSSYGVICGISSGTSFTSPRLWTNAMSDVEGWGSTAVNYYRTIQFGDINADGRADVCGRTGTGVVCALSNGSSFTAYRYIDNQVMTDANGWSNARYNAPLSIVDIGGAGRRDVCARSSYGIFCLLTRP